MTGPDRMQPYDDLPLLPPEGIETVAVLRQVARSARAVAELKATANALPDPSILINTVPLQEAQASSAIENIVTTQDALYKAAVSEREPDDPATREAMRYRTALRQAGQEMEAHGLDTDLLATTCSTILHRDVRLRGPGEFVHMRDGAGTVTYTPPSGGVVVERLMQNLETYLHADDDVDPLVRMAVAHYQFEAIHPFHDGNGRTGRILSVLMLLDADLLELPVLYLSRSIIERKQEYYGLLFAVTFQGAWEDWILWMLRGVEQAAQAGTERIRRIQELKRRTEARIQEELPHAYRHGLFEVLFRQPYCRIAHLVDAGVAKRQTASQYLRDLERIGILEGQKEGREVIYLHPALVEAVR